MKEKDDLLEGKDIMSVFEKDDLFSTVKALQVIQSQTNPSWVKTRGTGKNALDYVSGDTVTRMLNKAFNYRWSFHVLETRVVTSVDKVYKDFKTKEETVTPQNPVVQALGRLVVPGWGIREQWGSQPLQGGADVQEHAFKSAATDAMKKCASMFGIALDLYGQDGMSELMVTPSDILADDKSFFDAMKNAESKETKDTPAQEESGGNVQQDTPTPTVTPAAEEVPQQPAQPAQDTQERVASTHIPKAQPEVKDPELDKLRESTKTEKGPVSSYWSKEDIQALKDAKDRLGLADNDGLNIYTQEFFGNENSTYQQINPNNVKDFLLFLSTK